MTLFLDEAAFAVAGRTLVGPVTLAAAPGEVLALIGPNGAGKSTLLRLCAGLWRPTAGAAVLDGRALARWPRVALARRVAFVPQTPAVRFAFTVDEFVALGRFAHGGWCPADAPRCRAALARLDVTDLAGRFVTELSGGELRRVLLARALVTEADWLLLDEPTANLDPAHALAVLALCRALADEGRAVVLALHDLNAARRFADRVALLDRGRSAATGAPGEVLTPARIAAVFGVRAETVTTPGGETLLHLSARPPLRFGSG